MKNNILMVMFLFLATTLVWSANIPPRPADNNVPWADRIIHTDPVLERGLGPEMITSGYETQLLTSRDRDGREISYYIAWTSGASGSSVWVKFRPGEAVEAKKTGQRFIQMDGCQYVVTTWEAKRIVRCGNPTDITFYNWKLKEVEIKTLIGSPGVNGQNGLPGMNGQDGKNGAPGLPGLNGIGINGKDGLNGLNGIDGINGQDGRNGEQGPPGPAQPAPNIWVNPIPVNIQPANVYVQPAPAPEVRVFVNNAAPEYVYGSHTIGGDSPSWWHDESYGGVSTMPVKITNSNFQEQDQSQNQDQNQHQEVTIQ